MKSPSNPRRGVLRGVTPMAETFPPHSPHTARPQSNRRTHKENVVPNETTLQSDSSTSPVTKAMAKTKSPLPPRPPLPSSGNSLKRKLNVEGMPESGVVPSADSGVKVIVRIRPVSKSEDEGEQIVQRTSSNSLCMFDQVFSFDAVVGVDSTQQHVFELVGVPLVENCLAGFNSSIFAYGQTGSGKTYTMWGPTNSFTVEHLSNAQLGLTPRVFEQLFARIQEVKQSNKQLTYQCRCSFLEIYNEQITDLLDPSQKNLQVREDVKSGVYVESLTEECIANMKELNQVLMKGMSNRRVGATMINSESSRSHCVFTCIVESRYKSMTDGVSSLRTSRINFVDLAGSERQKLTGAAGDRLREAGNINRSLSQLGNLINILAEVSQTGKQRHIPYRDSRLTFLLQESLGGNAKLAMICAVSPAQSCKSETLSTLRFAQRAKAIQNKAVVNEITEDDVNVLREQIRQLKDELIRMKSDGCKNVDSNGAYSTGWNARRSLNLLRMSLNRPSLLPPPVEDDSDEEMEIVEEGVERIPTGIISASNIEAVKLSSETAPSVNNSGNVKNSMESRSSKDSGLVDANLISEESDVHMEDCHAEETPACHLEESSNRVEHNQTTDPITQAPVCSQEAESEDVKAIVLMDSSNSNTSKVGSEPDKGLLDDMRTGSVSSSHSIIPLQLSPVIPSPASCVSPRLSTSNGKSLRLSSDCALKEPLSNKTVSGLNVSLALAMGNALSARAEPNVPMEVIAASLQRGIQVLDQQSSGAIGSSFRFSFKTLDSKPFQPVERIDAGVQTSPEIQKVLRESSTYICSICKNKIPALDYKQANSSIDLPLVPINQLQSGDQDQPDSVSNQLSNDECKALVPVDNSGPFDVSTEVDGSRGAPSSEVDTTGECNKLVPVNGPRAADGCKILVPKAVEKVLAGSIRREMAMEEFCAKQAAEIQHLNRLLQQYKHERECNIIIEQTREDKIRRLEGLMDGIISTEEFMEQEFLSLTDEHKMLREKYDNHPEVLRSRIEIKKLQDELDTYRNFFDLGERDVLMEEVQNLRNQLQSYIDSSPAPSKKKTPARLQWSQVSESIPRTMQESSNEAVMEKFEQERQKWMETESEWICLTEELRIEMEKNRSRAEKHQMELNAEKKYSEELKDAFEVAMKGHARILEQYADLEEKHFALLARHRKIREGIADVKQAAARAGVKGAESRFINSLAAEISALKAEREKDRRYWRDENKGLQTQLRDTAEAVQAAGELLVRLKESEEAIADAKDQARKAEQKLEEAYQEIDRLKKASNVEKANKIQEWRDELDKFNDDDGNHSTRASNEASSWFTDYDRCNM